MKKLFYLSFITLFSIVSCSEDEDEKYYKSVNFEKSMTLDGGANAKNSVYVDLSMDKQIQLERSSWHLAFYCGSQFGVKLNSTIGARAVLAEDNISMNTVFSKEDSIYYGTKKLSLNMQTAGSSDIVDSYNGDLSKTVIKEKGRIYIYGSEDFALGLYKLKVTEKNANTYTVEYSKWNSAEVKTLDISKNNEYNFVGLSFADNKLVYTEPKKMEWDIIWGRNTYVAQDDMPSIQGKPFVMADIVYLNTRGGASAARILAEDIKYEEYSEGNIAATNFETANDVIGGGGSKGWRKLTSGAAVFNDRFYVIKDTEGNVYKLRFLSLINDVGERGYPQFEYALVRNVL